MSASTPEGKVKQAIKDVLTELEIYYFMPVQNGMGKRSLDFLCCVGGHYIGIEAKAPGKFTTRMQDKTIAEIANSGGTCFIVNNVMEAAYLRGSLALIKERGLVMKALEE